MLTKSLELFQSHIDFITWLGNVQKYQDGGSPLPNTSDLLALLHTSSPLSLIHRYLDIQTINSGEILDKLQKTIVDFDDDNDKPTKEKRVRFNDIPTNANELLRLPQTTALMIFLGYLAVNSVIECVLSPDKNQSNKDDLFSLTRTYLTQIYPLRFRLELLENMFSLVFIEQSELKIDETIEVVEQSTNTTSMSLSNSDKYLSSLQSNITNDSLHTSTNASVKTQVSIRRIDNDLDEHTDDNVSVCSSSMSSVGASQHQSIYRTGFLIDQQVLHQLLTFIRDQLAEVRSLYQKIKDKATDRDTIDFENSLEKCFIGCTSNNNDHFTTRASRLNTTISESLWRYQLLTASTSEGSTQENKNDGQENEDCLVDNPTIKNLILPLPVHRHRRKRRSRLTRLSETSTSSTSSIQTKPTSTIVAQILSTRDNLLAICLKEGKITEANEVIRVNSKNYFISNKIFYFILLVIQYARSSTCC
jgi:hypothetical protein